MRFTSHEKNTHKTVTLSLQNGNTKYGHRKKYFLNSIEDQTERMNRADCQEYVKLSSKNESFIQSDRISRVIQVGTSFENGRLN